MRSPDFSGLSAEKSQTTLMELTARYQKNPRDKVTIIYYSAALRANGQPEQAVAVLQAAIGANGKDQDIRIAYAKALASAGRFEQALTIVDDTINPTAPDWNALSVKGRCSIRWAAMRKRGRSTRRR